MSNNYAQITTPVGTAIYPHLRSTEVYEGEDTGKYTCTIKLDADATDKLMKRVENEWEMAKKTADFDGKRFGRNTAPMLGFNEDKDGEIRFKAKTNAVIKTKAGEIIDKTVPVFDKYGKPLDEDMEVGHGSKIRLCMLLRPFYASSSIYGVQLLLKAVQVLEYVAPNMGEASAEDCGFDVSEEEDCPFEDNKPDAEDAADF